MKRTTTKLYDTLLTMLAAFILISSLVLAALIFTDSFSVSAQAKTKKPYKTKTVKLVESKKKTWYPAHETKIKKIKKVSKNKSFQQKSSAIKQVCESLEQTVIQNKLLKSILQTVKLRKLISKPRSTI